MAASPVPILRNFSPINLNFHFLFALFNPILAISPYQSSKCTFFFFCFFFYIMFEILIIASITTHADAPMVCNISKFYATHRVNSSFGLLNSTHSTSWWSTIEPQAYQDRKMSNWEIWYMKRWVCCVTANFLFTCLFMGFNTRLNVGKILFPRLLIGSCNILFVKILTALLNVGNAFYRWFI